VVEASPSPTPTETATATPWPTAIDYGPLYITETAVALVKADLESQQQRINLEMTRQALNNSNAGMTATWAVPTMTQAAAQTLTPQAEAQATTEMSLTLTPAALDYQAKEKELEKQTVINSWLPIIGGTVALVIIGLGILVGVGLNQLLKLKAQALSLAADEPQAEPLRNYQQTAPVLQVNELGDGALAVEQLVIPPEIATTEQIEQLAAWVKKNHNGKLCTLPYSKLCGKDKPFSRGQLDNFRDYAEHILKIAFNVGDDKSERIVLNERGVFYFCQI